jgi:6,7-dimethyl-8-ribityllumazine synthase
VKDLVVEQVPGALEIPLALQWMAQSGKFDCLAALGCVVRGDTYHFEVVANESARGVMDVALEFGIPVANGILTTEDEAQAEARLDKGAEAVRVALDMARLRAKLAASAK